MRLKGFIRYFVEAVGICIAAVTIPLMPRSWVVGLARFLGNAGFRYSRRDRLIALANLDVAFGDSLSRQAREDIARESFRVFSLVLLDFFWFSLFSRKRVSACVRFDSSFDCVSNAGPVIILTAHYGNWEVLGQACAMRCGGLLSVAAQLDNPFVAAVLKRMRSRTGQQTVMKEGAVRPLLRELKAGGKIGLVIDQNVVPEEGGEFTRLFGLPVTMSRAAASLHIHSQSNMIFVYCLPDARGVYTACALPPYRHASGREKPDASEITQAVAHMLEEVIRRDPGKWVWSYKRWKFIPEGWPRDNFPFYAREIASGAGDVGDESVRK